MSFFCNVVELSFDYKIFVGYVSTLMSINWLLSVGTHLHLRSMYFSFSSTGFGSIEQNTME